MAPDGNTLKKNSLLGVTRRRESSLKFERKVEYHKGEAWILNEEVKAGKRASIKQERSVNQGWERRGER